MGIAKVFGVSLLCCLGSIHQFSGRAVASDHADPIDPLRRQRLEGGITDLFVFPVDSQGRPVAPYRRSEGLPLHNPYANLHRAELDDDQQKQIDSLVVILCMRRQLTDNRTLKLEPFTYQIHFDVDSGFAIPTEQQIKAETDQTGYSSVDQGTSKHGPGLVEAYARYGGKVKHPEKIQEDLTIEFRLNNDATLQADFPTYRGSVSAGFTANESDIRIETGVFDDPFIFPGFYGTNVVGVIIKIPVRLFPKNQDRMLIWANSFERSRPIDHVGRSLRTQNPRFEMLNKLHPSLHVAAIEKEHEQPGLMRDLGLRFNLASLFAFRQWDFAPDVMCYSLKQPVGFPNGRLLSDDVAAILAQHGDTLLYELSFEGEASRWPRSMANDRGEFKAEFPYLLEPNLNPPLPKVLGLSRLSVLKLLGIALVVLFLFLLENWIVARIYHRWKLRPRYL